MLREDLQKVLKESMLAHDALTTSAVRMIIAGMKEKDVDARGKGKEKATDEELMSMMQTMIKQRRESIELYEKGGRTDLADKEKKEIEIISAFLPAQMDDDAVKSAIEAEIQAVGASSMKDMGKVMGALRSKYAGQMDFGKASGMIKSLLG